MKQMRKKNPVKVTDALDTYFRLKYWFSINSILMGEIKNSTVRLSEYWFSINSILMGEIKNSTVRLSKYWFSINSILMGEIKNSTVRLSEYWFSINSILMGEIKNSTVRLSMSPNTYHHKTRTHVKITDTQLLSGKTWFPFQ